MSGQAASYYNENERFGGGQPPPPPPQQQQPFYNNNGNNGNYQYADPNYQRGPEPKQPQEPPPTYNQAVYGFDDAFKIEKPSLTISGPVFWYVFNSIPDPLACISHNCQLLPIMR